jgi:hypothetical protein
MFYPLAAIILQRCPLRAPAGSGFTRSPQSRSVPQSLGSQSAASLRSLGGCSNQRPATPKPTATHEGTPFRVRLSASFPAMSARAAISENALNARRINTYKHHSTNLFRIRTYKKDVVQVPCNEHLQKRGVGGSRLLLRSCDSCHSRRTDPGARARAYLTRP